MLDVLNHKCNTLITTATDGSIFQKIFKTIAKEKDVKRYYFHILRYTQVLQ